jgi:hypothetical protein
VKVIRKMEEAVMMKKQKEQKKDEGLKGKEINIIRR